MEKIIVISNKEVRLTNNISWCMEYRDQFGKDVVQDHVPMLASIGEALATVIAENGGIEKLSVNGVFASLEGRVMDLMIPLMQTEFMSLIINVTWAMAKACDETIPPPKQWVKQFDEFPLDEIVPTIYSLALNGFISSKNLKRLTETLGNLKGNVQPQ